MSPRSQAPRWLFQRNTTGLMTFKDPLAGLITANSELDATEILVRESLQNSLDARPSREGDGEVRVRYRLRTLRGDEKLAFLEEVGMSTLGPHVVASNEAIEENEGDPMADPDVVRAEDPIVVLYIEDHGTCGLIGPEFHDAAAGDAYDGPRCFLGLCRSIGVNDKASGGSGGTYGFGKGVYWANSSIGTAVFHSRLASSWTAGADEDLDGGSGDEVSQRLFGVARLTSHHFAGKSTLENGWLAAGENEDGQPRSFWNAGAEERARALGFLARGADDPGTSVLVLPLRDDEDGVGRSKVLKEAKPFAKKLARAAAHYFWPAIAAGRLVVEVQVDDEASLTVDPRDHHELTPFLEVSRALVADAGKEGLVIEAISAEVPAWADKDIQGGIAVVSMGVRIQDAEESRPNGPGPGVGRIALVRGAHMVVGYWDPQGRGTGTSTFHGVVHAGLAHGDEPLDHSMERLLQRAEPVTHDRWDEKSEPLKPWRAAQARVRDLLGRLRTSVSALVSAVEAPQGKGPLQLRKMLSLQGDGPPPGERWGSIAFPTPERRVHEGELARTERDVVVDLPARRGTRKRPHAVRILVSHGVKKDESSSARTKESVLTDLSLLELDGVDESKIERQALPDGSAALVLDLEENTSNVQVTLRASTGAMPVDRFGARRFDRRVTVQTPKKNDQ